MMNFLTVLASAGGEETQGLAALGIDPIVVLAQGVTFIIFFLVVKKMAFGPIVKTLEKRRKTIDESLEKAEELNQKNAEAEQRVAALLQDARKESEVIITKGKEESANIIKEAEDAAGKRAEKIVEDGKLQIQNEVEKAREALKKETLGLVAQATSVLLDEKVDAAKNEALIKKALAESKK